MSLFPTTNPEIPPFKARFPSGRHGPGDDFLFTSPTWSTINLFLRTKQKNPCTKFRNVGLSSQQPPRFPPLLINGLL